ncbi:MAG: hypothetical protein IJH71_07850 [Eubacterium sp.]|nr:hypothetical protein [Eubacterium sp.]
MAESILKDILTRRGASDIQVISRGQVVLFSEPVSERAVKILKDHGYKDVKERSAQLSEEDLESADLVLTLDSNLAEKVKENYEAQVSCMSIGTFVDAEEGLLEVTDEEESFLKCFLETEQLMEAAADRLIGELI